MWACAADEMRDRRLPTSPELMFECNCEILQIVSKHFSASAHGLSTLRMSLLFHTEFLEQALTNDDKLRLQMHIYHGYPVLRSACDGAQPRDSASPTSAATQTSPPPPRGGAA